MAQDWPLGPRPRTEGGAPRPRLWAQGHGRVGCAGLERAQVSRETPKTTQLAWGLGLKQPGCFLRLCIIRDKPPSGDCYRVFAQGPPHSSVLALCLNKQQGGWDGPGWGVRKTSWFWSWALGAGWNLHMRGRIGECLGQNPGCGSEILRVLVRGSGSGDLKASLDAQPRYG